MSVIGYSPLTRVPQKMFSTTMRGMKGLPQSVLARGVVRYRASPGGSKGALTQGRRKNSRFSAYTTTSSSDLDDHRDMGGASHDLDHVSEDQGSRDVSKNLGGVSEDLGDVGEDMGDVGEDFNEDGVGRLQSICLPNVFLPPAMEEAIDTILTGEFRDFNKLVISLCTPMPMASILL